MASYRDNLSSGNPSSGCLLAWSFIKVVCHQGGHSSGWSLTRVASHQGFSLTRVVSHQGFSLTRVVSHQGFFPTRVASHQVFSLTRVVSHQVFPPPEWSLIRVFSPPVWCLTSIFSLTRVVSHQVFFHQSGVSPGFFPHQSVLSSGFSSSSPEWSLIRDFFHQNGLSSGFCSLTRVVSQHGGLSSGWLFIRLAYLHGFHCTTAHCAHIPCHSMLSLSQFFFQLQYIILMNLHSSRWPQSEAADIITVGVLLSLAKMSELKQNVCCVRITFSCSSIHDTANSYIKIPEV